MKWNFNSIRNTIYETPFRYKIIILSGLTFILFYFISVHTINYINQSNLSDQYYASIKKSFLTISAATNKIIDLSILNNLSELDYIEKINIISQDGQNIFEYDSNDYEWNQLTYVNLPTEYKNRPAKIVIAVNKIKYIKSLNINPTLYREIIIFIVSLLCIIFIIIINNLILKPIEKVSSFLSEIEPEHDDDKSRSQIIELSKTIAVLKRSINLRKEKETQLISIQERLSSVLNTIGDAIITINKESTIVMVNPAFEKIWGYHKDDVLGKKLEMVMPEKYRGAHNVGLQRYLDTGVENVINQNLELEGLHSDGTVFPIEIHISETRINEDLFFTAAIKDITQRKRTEQELIDAKENVEELLELRTHDLVTRLNELNCLYGLSKLIEDSDVNISYILKETLILITTACKFTDNACCLINYNGHEYKTKNYLETTNMITQGISIKNKKKGYVTICYLNDNYPNYEEQFLPYEKKLLDTVCVRLSRYLEHKKAKEELDSANEALRDTQLQLIQAEKLDTIGTLSAGVAHEVKNPLAVIQLGIDYLSKKSIDNENIKEVIKEMDEAINRADSVIKELVNFSASNDLTLEQLDVNKLIDGGLSLVRHELVKNNISINKNYYNNLTEISGDKQKLEQVIINLVINAIHAMEESVDKTLKIRTFPLKIADMGLDITGRFNINDKVVAVTIEDSGTGIDKEKLEKLFDPFFTTKPSGKGTGLGLTVCQNIIRLHGGTLRFENSESGGVIVTLLFKA